jgi:hypothetical protein
VKDRKTRDAVRSVIERFTAARRRRRRTLELATADEPARAKTN